MNTYRTVLNRKIFNELKKYLNKWDNGKLNNADDHFSMMSNIPFDEHQDKVGIGTPYYALNIIPKDDSLEVAIFEDFNNVKKGSCLISYTIDGNWIILKTKKMVVELISIAEIEDKFGITTDSE